MKIKYRYIHITAALFFIASMAVQFVVSYRRTMSNVLSDNNPSVTNSPALTEDIDQSKGQDVEKVVFDATKLGYISSSGVRVILYCKKYLGKSPEIVFVNCNKDILDVFDLVGLIPHITFLTNP